MVKLKSGSVSLGISTSPRSAAARQSADVPFRILILGDFSGRANRGLQQSGRELAGRRIVDVDRDNFDEVLQQFDARLDRTIVDSTDHPVSVQFHDLDDFEPDSLYRKVDLFQQLRTTRQQLLNQNTFAAAAAEVRRWAGLTDSEPDTPASAPPAASGSQPASSAAPAAAPSLEAVIGNTMQQREAPAGLGTDLWNAMIRELVDPYKVAAPDPDTDVLVDCVDQATSESLRKLLHHPDFQQLESIWRGLRMLVRRLETDRSLRIHVLDVSRPELTADLQTDKLTSSSLYRLIVEQSQQTAGADPWGVIVSCESFSADADDIQTLQQLGQLAAAAQAPLLAAASGQLVGCPKPAKTPDPDDWQTPQTSDNPDWQVLCESSAADWVQLLWPRYLARSPYGRELRRVEAFDFEELTQPLRHDDLLWGNPALAAAVVLGQCFTESGWDMQPGEIDEVDDLPVLLYEDEDGETVQHPSGELWLSDRGIEQLHKSQVVPLLSIKSVAAVRLGGFRSLSGKPLAGRWS